MSTSTHRWKFFRVGGVEQVVIKSGADIVNLDQLDQRLWVALACPVKGIELDAKTLAMIDTDNDGRVRVPEVLAAVRWVREVFKNPDDLFKGGDSVPLASINEQSEAGAALLQGARRIQQNLGKGGAAAISLADVADTARIFAETRFNGDGIVPADAAEDADTRQAIEDIIATHGSVIDRSGKPGVNQALCDAFFTEATALSEFHGKAEADPGILPLGPATAAAADAVRAVRVKVDDYFTRCRLAAFDGRAGALLSGAEGDLVALATRDLAPDSAEVARLPLSRIEAGRPLQLTDGVNPAWAAALQALGSAAVAPILGGPRTSLNERDWALIKDRLAAYFAWADSKPATKVEGLGLPRLRALLAGGAKERVSALIAQDAALAAENDRIAEVEKLIRFQRDLVKLLANFVNFSEFYSGKGGVFQAGTLYMDARSCDLCVPVEDAGKHAALAGLAKAHLLYCDCARASGEKMSIAAAVTEGDVDNLIVGRNGVFYDRSGRDWDATVTKIIENPISVRQAFWSPYKRFVRLVEEQVAKRAAEKEAKSTDQVSLAAKATAHADETKAGAPADGKKIDVGTVAAIGVAVAGFATFLSSVLATFLGLGMWMPLGIAALLLAISGPSMLIAWLKLRQRNLGPILDANGWAVNTRAKINVPFGAAMTRLAMLPPGSERSVRDPYADKQRPWALYVFLGAVFLVALLWYVGKLDGYLPPPARSTEVLGKMAPAYLHQQESAPPAAAPAPAPAPAK